MRACVADAVAAWRSGTPASAKTLRVGQSVVYLAAAEFCRAKSPRLATVDQVFFGYRCPDRVRVRLLSRDTIDVVRVDDVRTVNA